MKKLSILAVMLVSLLSPMKETKALMTPLTGDAGFILSAYPVMGGLALMFNSKKCHVALCIDKVAGLALFVGGVIFADENSGKVEFKKVSELEALKIGLTVNEKKSFNNSIEEINILKDEIFSEVALVDSQRVELADSLWHESADFLDEDAYSAIEKVRAHIGRQLLKQ